MKGLTLLLALSVFLVIQNASAYKKKWQFDMEKKHWRSINSIIKTVLDKVQKIAGAMSTPNAKKCLSFAEEKLDKVAQRGQMAIIGCIKSAKNVATAEACAHRVESGVFEKSGKISIEMKKCIKHE